LDCVSLSNILGGEEDLVIPLIQEVIIFGLIVVEVFQNFGILICTT